MQMRNMAVHKRSDTGERALGPNFAASRKNLQKMSIVVALRHIHLYTCKLLDC